LTLRNDPRRIACWGDEAEPALYLIEPAGVGRGVVDVVARPARQPGLNLRMLVRAVVVRHQMDVEPGRDTAVEVIKKGREIPGGDGAAYTG